MSSFLSALTSRKNFWPLAISIVLFAALARLLYIHFPPSFYFDEVYHGFTATTYLHNDPKGYEYWASPPEGVAYEWTHPPLAKLLMAAGMFILGENSVGWRSSSVVFGTGVIALTGVLAHQLFGRKRISLLAMLLASFDGLLLSMSRIAMNDMHFLFFMLCSLICYIEFKKVLFVKDRFKKQVLWWSLTMVSIALALASKWTALYLGAAITLDFAVTLLITWKFPWKTLITVSLLSLFIVPTIYLSSYLQFFMQGHTLKEWKETTQQMWWYHTGLEATHGYQSRPIQWILNLRPVWMHVDYTQSEQKRLAHIYNVGNPLFFWTGLVAVGFLSVRILHATQKRFTAFVFNQKLQKPVPVVWNLAFPLFVYFFMWTPWIVSPRIMFFYHYAPALPLLAILTAYGFDKLIQGGKQAKALIYVLVLLSAVVFVVLYPMNTGIFMPERYFDLIFSVFPMWK